MGSAVSASRRSPGCRMNPCVRGVAGRGSRCAQSPSSRCSRCPECCALGCLPLLPPDNWEIQTQKLFFFSLQCMHTNTAFVQLLEKNVQMLYFSSVLVTEIYQTLEVKVLDFCLKVIHECSQHLTLSDKHLF